uniref:CST complex subunit CTC1 n=1 Tax=Mesocestoides corti TaxID=53468 RepID=A0A5K3FP73_MESCO
MFTLHAVEHCGLKDSDGCGSCGTLWLKADSRAFWETWLQGPTATQCPGPQTLVAQLSIEFAANVVVAARPEVGLGRLVIGRCIKVGIEIRFLPSNEAPIRILNPILNFAPETFGVNAVQRLPKDSCFFQFQAESVISSKVRNLLQPSPHCRFYRIEVDIELFWLRQNLLYEQNGKPLTIATQWEPFVVSDGSEAGETVSTESIIMGLVSSDSPENLPGQTGVAMVLRWLSEVLRGAALAPLAVATYPTDELLLPLPLPHSLGKLLENSIEIRWTSRLVLSVSLPGAPSNSPRIQHYVLPNQRFGRIVPLSAVSSTKCPSPWYLPLLKSPQFVAKLIWGEKIWLQLVQRSHAGLSSYLAQDCPVCRGITVSGGDPAHFTRRNAPPVDSMAIHIKVSPLSCLPLELVGGIEKDNLFDSIQDILLKQFGPFVDPSNRTCVNLSETQADFVSDAAVMENLPEGLVLHRLWMGLAVYGVDERCQRLTSPNYLAEGNSYLLNGPLRGQTGLFVGGPTVTDGVEGGESAYGTATLQSLLGSVVFLKTGNFFVRGLVGLLPLPNGVDDSVVENTIPPIASTFTPVKQTSQSFLFHVRN